jgi:hypothetical protein
MFYVVVGCQTQSVPVAKPATKEAVEVSSSTDIQSELPFTVVTADTYADQLTSLRGNVVLVDMWATW